VCSVQQAARAGWGRRWDHKQRQRSKSKGRGHLRNAPVATATAKCPPPLPSRKTRCCDCTRALIRVDSEAQVDIYSGAHIDSFHSSTPPLSAILSCQRANLMRSLILYAETSKYT
jgi:hypothetical protein